MSGAVEASRIGGHLSDIPKPHRRRYGAGPKERRPVKVQILSFVGVVPWAKHWTARIEESHNPIWNSELERWQQCWDDEKGEGRVFRKTEFGSKSAAERYAAEVLAEHFSRDTHIVEDLYDDRERIWNGYLREGD